MRGRGLICPRFQDRLRRCGSQPGGCYGPQPQNSGQRRRSSRHTLPSLWTAAFWGERKQGGKADSQRADWGGEWERRPPWRGSTTGPHLLERKLARMGVHVTRRMKGLSLTCKASADVHKSSLLRTYPLLPCTPSCGLRCCCPSYSTSVYREGNSVMWSWRHPFQRFTPRGPDAYWSVKGGGVGTCGTCSTPESLCELCLRCTSEGTG